MPLDLGTAALADLPLVRASQLHSSARHAPVGTAEQVQQHYVPVRAGLSQVLGEPGLRAGASYLVESSLSLALALMAGPEPVERWVSVIGLPELGAQSAAGLGIDLDHLALIPDPGQSWLEVLATVCDAVDVVAIRPPSRPADAAVRRIAARMRQRGSALIVLGDQWPGAFMRLSVTDSSWCGMRPGGHGYLSARHALVTRVGKNGTDEQRMWLPAPDGGVRPYDERSAQQPSDLPTAPTLRAVR